METIKISEIKVNGNPRRNFSGVDEIAESIKRIGLLQPVTVRRGDNDEVVLVDGEQRLRALKKLGRKDAPVHFIEVKDEQGHKEAQMIANLYRSDLSLIERMRGFSALLENAPAKYNEKVIANKFGLKEAAVKKMIKMVRKINPACDQDLSSGQFDEEDIELLARVPQDYQAAVVKKGAEYNSNKIWRSAWELSHSLYFDDVFTESKAKSSGRAIIEWPNNCELRTFDKAYASEVKREYEARTKKDYEKESTQARKAKVEKDEKSTEERRQEREAKKERLKKVLNGVKDTLPSFLLKSVSEKNRRDLIEWTLQRIWKDNLKGLLLAFGVECSSASNDAMRKSILTEIIDPMLEDRYEAEKNKIALNFYELFNMLSECGWFQVSNPEAFEDLVAKMKGTL